MYNFYNNTSIRTVTLCLSLCSFLFRIGAEAHDKVSILVQERPREWLRLSADESPNQQKSLATILFHQVQMQQIMFVIVIESTDTPIDKT